MTLSYNLMLRSVGFAVRPLQIFALAAAGVMTTPVMQAAHAGCEDSPGRAVDWQECRKTSVMLNGIDLADGNFEKANLSSSDIRNARLIGSNFSKANLVRASLAGANASNADFSGAIASRTDFSEGIFKDTNFFKAEITRADFSGSLLENANMSKGQFSRVTFSGTTLKDVNFEFSSLARSDLRDVKLEGEISMYGTFLFRTHLEGVDLNKISGLKDWQLELACGDETTQVPEGLTRPTTWPCPEEDDS